jgi:hypothetical protein
MQAPKVNNNNNKDSAALVIEPAKLKPLMPGLLYSYQ